MIGNDPTAAHRLAWLGAQGPRWFQGTPATEPVRLMYGQSTIEPHSHWSVDSRDRKDVLTLPVVCLTFVLAGTMEVDIDGLWHRAGPGDLLITPVPGRNGLRQAAEGLGNVHAYIILHHDYLVRRLAPLVRSGRLVAAVDSAALLDACDQVFRRGLAGLYADPACEEIDLFAVARQTEALLQETPSAVRRGRSWTQAVARATLEALPRRPAVAELAARVGVSTGYFVRTFRVLTGQTPATFVTSVLLDEATRLLVETRLPLKAIAAKVGFSSDQALAHAFRHHRGRTAASLRRAESGSIFPQSSKFSR